MAEIIKMPRLSDTMTEGTVAEWHKKVGDTINSGDLIAEIETDKATMEFEAFLEEQDQGVVLYLGLNAGETIPVDSILAIVGKEGENIDDIISKNKVEVKENTKEEFVKIEEVKKDQEVIAENKQLVVDDNSRIKASPLAKKIAKENNINLLKIEGTGEGGRIIKRDVENIETPIEKQELEKDSDLYSFETENVSQMRKTIAKRLSESKFTSPHFYLNVTINMDEVIKFRKKLFKESDLKVSINDFVVKASSVALKKHKYVNSSWQGDVIKVNKEINIGVAVAVEDGLVVPVIKNANTLTLSEINDEVKTLAKLAYDKKLKPNQWEGNTFTISNLGMYDIESFTAIINPPDACILAVGTVKEKPIVRKGKLKIGNQMKVTLSCDHRVVDGVVGAKFLSTLKSYLENPLMLI